MHLSQSVSSSGAFSASIGCLGGAKSALTCSISGIRAYLTTRYPASSSILSLSASRLSLPRWLLSSSSMIARTCMALSQMTKSAIFRSNLFLVLFERAVSNAPKLTCARTTISGSDCVSRLYIAASFLLSGCFRRGRSAVSGSRCWAVCFLMIAKIKNATAIAMTMVVVDTAPPDVNRQSCHFVRSVRVGGV